MKTAHKKTKNKVMYINLYKKIALTKLKYLFIQQLTEI